MPPELEIFSKCDKDTRDLYKLVLKRRYRIERERFWLNFCGLITGFLIALAFLGVSAWLIHEGHDVSGTILATVDIVALASVFVYANSGRRRK